jgi:hypothetical protein
MQHGDEQSRQPTGQPMQSRSHLSGLSGAGCKAHHCPSDIGCTEGPKGDIDCLNPVWHRCIRPDSHDNGTSRLRQHGVDAVELGF